MSNKLTLFLLLFLSLISSRCFSQNVAIVNGKPVPSSRVEIMVKQMIQQGQKDSPEMRSMIKNELIDREILAQEAYKVGINRKKIVQDQIELAKQSIVIRALILDYLDKNPVDISIIKKEYDKFKSQSSTKEYRSKHILVENKKEADEIILKLNNGESFSELAKLSKDPGSSGNGGELGWQSPKTFVKEFSDAMVSLKVGEFTNNPVKTQFGYHIIKLEETRNAKVPSFNEVKEQISEGLKRKKVSDYQESLKKKAKIQ